MATEAGADAVFYASEIKQEPVDVDTDCKETIQIDCDADIKEEEVPSLYSGCEVQEVAKELFPDHVFTEELEIGPEQLRRTVLNERTNNDHTYAREMHCDHTYCQPTLPKLQDTLAEIHVGDTSSSTERVIAQQRDSRRSAEVRDADMEIEAGADIAYYASEIKQEPVYVETDCKETQQIDCDADIKEEDVPSLYSACEVKEEVAGELYPDHVISEELVIGPVVLRRSVLKPHDTIAHPSSADIIKVISEELVIGPVVLRRTAVTPHDKSTHSPTVGSCPLCHQYLWPHASGTPHRCEGGERETHATSPAGGKRTYICDVCGTYFTSRRSVVTHLRGHSVQKPLLCTICKKRFSAKSSLAIHARTHTGEKPFQCKICKNRFSQKYYLTVHERIHTGEKPFHCEICKKRFIAKSSLAEHERTHTGEKPFNCKICNKQFSLKSNLSVHERTHTGAKPFHCKICKKRFSAKCNLIAHELTHTGVKPFHCKICKKRFSAKRGLAVHERVHTGEIHCKICKKQFCRKANLTRHERTHTGEKPFHCKICKKRFTAKSSLAEHERTHTGEIHCKICNKQFSRIARLTRHERTHTRETT